MFKAILSRKGIFAPPRSSLRSIVQNSREPSRIQYVRFDNKKVPTFRRVIINVAGIVATYYVFQMVFTDRLSKIDLPPPTAEEKEEMKEPFFIPVLGTTQQVTPKPYKSSDPEWQEFVKFAKDKELGTRVREDLANMIKASCENHPILALRCGKTMKIRRHWLDIDFPMVPPPEFERSGIEITDEYVAWTTKPLDATTALQIRNVVWPVQSAMAFFAFFRVIATNAIGNTLTAVGLKAASPRQPTLEELLAKRADVINVMKKVGQGGKPDSTTKDPLSVSTTRDLDQVGQTDASKIDGILGGSADDRMQQAKEATLAHFKDPIQAFKKKVLAGMTATKFHPPRGSLFVSGLVELDTPNAWLVVDVKAAWDPKTREYDKRSMVTQLRRMQMKRQHAAGGR